MKRIIVLLTFLISGICSFAQGGKSSAFKIIVIKPDTAIVESSLYRFRDSITKSQISRYYRTIKSYEDMAKCKDCAFEKEDVARYQKVVLALKARETEVKKNKYFHFISSYSAEVYNFYFDETGSNSTAIEKQLKTVNNNSLKSLADRENANFIVFFSNIKTVPENNTLRLSLTTSVYSKKENRIIFSEEIKGNQSAQGEMWQCDNPLSCLMMSAIKESTTAATEVIKSLRTTTNKARN